MTPDPLKILSDALDACCTASADEIAEVEAEACEAFRTHGAALLDEVRRLRAVVDMAELTLQEIRGLHAGVPKTKEGRE